MKIIARYNVQLGGRIYTKGQAASYEGPVTERIAANFTDENGGPLSVDVPQTGDQAQQESAPAADDIIERTATSLGRDGIRRQLDDMGVTYSTSSNTKYLAKLLLTVKGEIKEG